jgi:fatty acid desaturase
MGPLMLRYRCDRLSLLYLVLFPALAAAQWAYGLSAAAYVAMLVLSVGLGVIHHNHTHLPLWRSRRRNRATDVYLSVAQAVPTFVFAVSHIRNHHRFRHGPRDDTRTYRFGGDHNHLWGYLTHPLRALTVLVPIVSRELGAQGRRHPERLAFARLQIAAIGAVWLALACADARKFALFWLLPQLHGLHWLLAANYLQHAHADGHSATNYARNFTGLVNRVWFNIGYHTAHHERPSAHWSELPREHETHRGRIDGRLVETSVLAYVFRTYLLGSFLPSRRTESLMRVERQDRPSRASA